MDGVVGGDVPIADDGARHDTSEANKEENDGNAE